MRPLNRKMFRKKGGSKGTGIMASGPELLKRFNGGGVNVPGGGSTLARSGFPGVTAFGSSIPPIVQPPGAVKVPDQLGFYKIPGLGVSTPIPKSSIATLIGPNRTRFGKSALEQLAETESQIGRQVGPFSLKSGLVASIDDPQEKFKEKDPKPTREKAYASGFRDLGPGINQSIINANEMTGVDQFDELQTDYDKVEEEKIKENKKKTIYEQSTNTDVNNEIETVVMDKKGEGTELKGTGAAVQGKGKTDGNSQTTKGKWSLYVDKLQKDVAAGKNVDGADSTLLAHGFDKDTVKEMSTEDKVKEVRGIIENIYGKGTPDSKDMGLEDDLAAMDAVMLGLSIAAGESPDALTNVIRGSKDYVGKRAARLREELKQNKQDQKDLDMLTLKTILQREDKKSDRDFQEKIVKLNQNHDMKKIATQNSNELEKLGIQLDFKTYLNESNQTFQWKMKEVDVDIANVKMKNEFTMLTKRLKSAELIARNQQLGEDERAAADREAAETRAIIGNFDKGYGLAFIEGKNKKLTGDKLIDYAMKNGKKFAQNSLLTGPDSIRRLVINNAGTIMKEQNVDFGEATQIIYNAILNDPKLNKVFAKDIEALGLNLNIGNKTDTSGFKVIKEN